jgi:hypothetical protein
MIKLILFAGLVLSLAVGAFAQGETNESTKPTDADKTAAIPADSYLKRGAAIGNSEKVSLNKVLKDPSKFTGKTVLIEGVVVRSCKMEGCWAEVAENKDSKSVRIKMKDHKFFIPLQSAGASARVEGTFQIKTLTKAMVDHMIEEDGAKFDNRNADGTVTEVSFEATGIELKKGA